MSYLVNQARLHSLTVNGVDYTAAMVSWTCNDSSANKQGLISTGGTLTLGQVPGGYNVEDYDRDNFKRGMPVVLEVTYPSGTTARHPRGLLYVLATSYSPQENQLTVDIGCRLSLAKLTDSVDALVALSPITLDPTQQTYSNVSAAFASAGQYLYQDNQGNLVSGTYFDGDSTESTAPGDWVSVLGVTALSVQPLAGTSPIPDQIALSYRVPADTIASDESGKVVEDVTESYYYITYPAVVYQRTGNGFNESYTGVESTGQASSCGNTPSQPADNGTPSCTEGYETVQTPYILPAKRIETRRTEYSGPGGQVSRVYTQIQGPALEANGQYFSDKFAYCRATWATACQPNGACPFDGEAFITLSYQEQLNYYGEANELVRTVTDTYNTTLSGAQPFNWRSGVVNGAPQSFTDLSLTDMYRVSSVVTEYYYGDNQNKQETTTYTSVTSRQAGITGDIDALAGIKTFQRRTSTTISTNPLIPDLVNNSTTSTVDQSTTLRLYTGRYQEPPAESGPYILEDQIPVPLLFDTQQEIDDTVNAYSNYLERFVKGDAFGLQIGEALREQIATNWHPGMPFRYYDAKKGRTMAMRMDATNWGVDGEGSALVTNGIWIGESDGTVTVNRNLVGDSRPDGTPPAASPGEPTISGENFVDSGSYAFDVDVHMMLQDLVTWIEPARSADTSYDAQVYETLTVWCAGLIVEAGDVASVNPDGSIPLDLNGSLVIADATVVDADVFA